MLGFPFFIGVPESNSTPMHFFPKISFNASAVLFAVIDCMLCASSAITTYLQSTGLAVMILLHSATLDQEKMYISGVLSLASSADWSFFFFLGFFFASEVIKPVAPLAVRLQSSIRETGEITKTLAFAAFINALDQTQPMIVLPGNGYQGEEE